VRRSLGGGNFGGRPRPLFAGCSSLGMFSLCLCRQYTPILNSSVQKIKIFCTLLFARIRGVISFAAVAA
jgi:hypothetical protein